MRRKHLLWIAPWIAFGLGACATSVPRPEVSNACAEWRWIGIKKQPEAKCPLIPGWDEQPLFASLAGARVEADYYGKEKKVSGVAPSSEVVQELERFCVYEKDKSSGNVPFPKSGELVRIDQDCAAIAATGDSWTTLSDHFLAQAGKPKAPLKITNLRGVRLAFLDTHPTSEAVPIARPSLLSPLPPAPPLPLTPLSPIPGTSEHGYTLTHIARNLICSPEGGGSCAALITTRLALPIRYFDPKSQERTVIDTEHGGHMGMHGHLADAIRSEVDDWHLARLGDETAPQHLVLNLSLAWDGELFGDLKKKRIAEMQAGTQAVYWALRYAAGFDVLVLAAAGNQSDCPAQTEGPLLPAAWEKEAPLDGSRHEASTPLLYAVGGVGSDGYRLRNSRRKGMPRRAANGEYAVVPSLTSGESTTMYTGSSIATAVASSIAAIVWDTLPDRDSIGIMEILGGSGIKLEETADFWFGSGTASAAQAPKVHMLSLCAALESACRLGPSNGCPLQSKCEPWVPENFKPDLTWDHPRPNSCSPWLHPQPPDEPCPICKPPRFDQ